MTRRRRPAPRVVSSLAYLVSAWHGDAYSGGRRPTALTARNDPLCVTTDREAAFAEVDRIRRQRGFPDAPLVRMKGTPGWATPDGWTTVIAVDVVGAQS